MGDKDTLERAKELFVYAPVGLAVYVRDAAPSFLKVFVARGRAELDQKRRSVSEQLGQVRDAGASVTGESAPQVLRLVSDGLARVRETAEGAISMLGTLGDQSGEPSPTERRTPSAAPEPRAATGGDDPGLAIPDYDALSASQVVDRLEGLAPSELEAIRAYEATHRARATILGKIDQLTRAS